MVALRNRVKASRRLVIASCRTVMPLNSQGICSGTRSTSGLTPCSRARLVKGSFKGVALIFPDFTAASRCGPPPYSSSVTSLRESPNRCKASVTVESLSEPNVLTPTTPPLRSAAVFTPGAEKNVKRMTLLSEPITRKSPPARLSFTAEDSPTCMTSRWPACSSCAPRLPPLMLRISTLRP